MGDCVFDADGAVHGFDEVFDDREAEAGATDVAGAAGVDAVEALEQALFVFAFDARSVVFDDEAGDVVVAGGADADVSSGWCVFDRVVDQIDEDLIERLRVAFNR